MTTCSSRVSFYLKEKYLESKIHQSGNKVNSRYITRARIATLEYIRKTSSCGFTINCTQFSFAKDMVGNIPEVL